MPARRRELRSGAARDVGRQQPARPSRSAYRTRQCCRRSAAPRPTPGRLVSGSLAARPQPLPDGTTLRHAAAGRGLGCYSCRSRTRRTPLRRRASTFTALPGPSTTTVTATPAQPVYGSPTNLTVTVSAMAAGDGRSPPGGSGHVPGRRHDAWHRGTRGQQRRLDRHAAAALAIGRHPQPHRRVLRRFELRRLGQHPSRWSSVRRRLSSRSPADPSSTMAAPIRRSLRPRASAGSPSTACSPSRTRRVVPCPRWTREPTS